MCCRNMKQSFYIDILCVVLAEETSGSEEENMHHYSPASDLSHRTRKKKKPKTQSKTSQSLFSVILSVNHGLVSLQTNANVNSLSFSLHCLVSLFLEVVSSLKSVVELPSVFSRRRIKWYWKTNTASSGWRWKIRCCSVWHSMKVTRTNTTSVSTPAAFACTTKVSQLRTTTQQNGVYLHYCCCCLLTSHSVNLPRTCRWRHICFRYQVAMQNTSPLVRANYLSIGDISWEILNTFRGYWPGDPQHGVCCCQNLVTECRTQCKGRTLKSL